MKFSLLCITPFSQDATHVTSLQETIFKQTGNASGLALPPHYPLVYLPTGYNLNSTKQILTENKWSGDLSAGSIKDKHHILYLDVEFTPSPENFNNWKSHIYKKVLAGYRPPLTHAVSAKELMFPVNGFFLGMDSASHEAAAPSLPAQSGQLSQALRQSASFTTNPLRLHTFKLELLLITIYASLSKWWENIEWEILLSVKCK